MKIFWWILWTILAIYIRIWIINNSCAVAHLLMIHFNPETVGIVTLNLISLLHFCCLEILHGMILFIFGFFSNSKRNFEKSGNIRCSSFTFLKSDFEYILYWLEIYYSFLSTSIKFSKFSIISFRSDDFITIIQKLQDITIKSSHVFKLNLFLTCFGMTICHFIQMFAVHSIFSSFFFIWYF